MPAPTNYTDLATLKSYLDITDSAKDTLLQMYLDSAERVINGFFSVDTMRTSDYTERLKIAATYPYNDSRGYEFFMRKRPVHSIKSINGISYTGVLGTDYIIENHRKVTFKQIAQYLTGFWWDSCEFVYSAGFDTIPADFQLAELQIAANMYATAGSNNAYQSYQIGDEKVVFKSAEDAKQVLALLKPYKIYV